MTELERAPVRPVASLIAAAKSHALLLFGVLALMWLALGLDALPFVDLKRYGIHPRRVDGLPGILAAPLLHGGLRHLLANSGPFLLLGGIVLLGGRRLFWEVTLVVVVLGGLGVWVFAGQNTNHIGASGLVFGYLGFLLTRGWVERSPGWILVGVVLFCAFGGLLYGVLPGQPGVSWQAHFFGLLAGIFAARLRRSSTHTLPGPGTSVRPPSVR